MTTIDQTKPVMVTGATGYVAGWIIKRLLDEGITVHAAVRDPENTEKLKYLNALAEASAGSIKYFKSDLLIDRSYDEAMQGGELVIHTASPFVLQVKDAQTDLIDPALKGTRNVLEAVNKTESVKRVVLTSSCAAIYGDNIDMQALPNQAITEDVWNTSSSLEHQPYSYSKTLAEQEAWQMNEAQSRWDLVVINPALVMGPGINPKSTSESFNMVKQMVDGTMGLGAPDFRIGVVDVREVAEAHFRAGFRPEAQGRHIVSAESTTFLELANYLRKIYGNKYPLPKWILPKFMMWLIGPFVGVPRKTVSRSMGYSWKADNSKSKEALGLTYRPLETTILEFFQQMLDEGVIKKK